MVDSENIYYEESWLRDLADKGDRQAEVLIAINAAERPLLGISVNREIAKEIAILFADGDILNEVALHAAHALCEIYRQRGVAYLTALENTVQKLHDLKDPLADIVAARYEKEGGFTYSDRIYNIINSYLIKSTRVSVMLKTFSLPNASMQVEGMPQNVHQYLNTINTALREVVLAGVLTEQTKAKISENIAKLQVIEEDADLSDDVKSSIASLLSDINVNLKLVNKFLEAKSHFELIRAGEEKYQQFMIWFNVLHYPGYEALSDDVARLRTAVKDVQHGRAEKAVQDLQLLQRLFNRKKTAWGRLNALSQDAVLLQYLDLFAERNNLNQEVRETVVSVERQLLGSRDEAGTYALEIILHECIGEPNKLSSDMIDSIVNKNS